MYKIRYTCTKILPNTYFRFHLRSFGWWHKKRKGWFHSYYDEEFQVYYLRINSLDPSNTSQYLSNLIFVNTFILKSPSKSGNYTGMHTIFLPFRMSVLTAFEQLIYPKYVNNITNTSLDPDAAVLKKVSAFQD